ncbi:glycosyltransferase family 4 protein [Pedobacter punctiformis]|uniref:Glycosyltransferase family 4 protein n=1 Tax=Pedobacter punctiformis TaxID=3004097 RepID=A0ABT4L9U5_9SPHI|nr:glycosyltransferase family 4 protein [Pedobacter sp. HCMS5-2]MCZ4244707.1 glycosyltransferase family 4 protein [Pedobacter sp. HCMS5-2]
MRISVFVPGRLHGFEMALYFQKMGILNELVTGYPKKYVVPFGIEKQFVKSIYLNEIINRTTNWLGLGYPLDFLACEAFDYLASTIIKFDSHVYFIWSGYGLKTIRKIRQKNPAAKVIIVRGSAHIDEQEYLLKKINNSTKQQINPRIIKKELEEYRCSDYITVPSSFAFDSFINRGINKEKLFLNFLGVNLEEFPFKEKNIDRHKPLIFGNVGTLSKRKNVLAIIEVLHKLNLNGHNFKLILAGQIDHESFDASILKKYTFIDYRGKVDQRELHLIYAEIDVFIINSIEEGLAMVQLQAMSCGCPIIATTNTGGTDIVKNYENGIIISILDDNALEKSIIWFNDHKDDIHQMSIKSREIAQTGFTWDDFGKRNLDFIKKILQN